VLGPGDEPGLAPFFVAHPDTTLFFQSNLRGGGIVDRGQPQQGTYGAIFEHGRVVALACHCWNGNLLLEAPRALSEVAHAVVRASGRPVSAIIGTHAQVRAAQRALGLEGRATTMDSCEDLFSLDLTDLRVPASLADGKLRCRSPRDDELELLGDWRHDYSVEALGRPPDEKVRQASRAEMAFWQRLGRNFVLEEGDRLVSYAGYNAETPACVQIGGVWTPPVLRGRGYAKAVVAGALLAARDRGVARSVLFTDPENLPAQAAYRSLGYQRVGDYALVMFAEPQKIPSGKGPGSFVR
jgi:RimJ/RimL family protein N-acetyltransferase